ncbi:MAG: PIN domain-containing protein [Candidatus Thermoplasmatota archaeon]|nr:PIN domain-containing protein [Candidatus Thermoplasmatota archaeon]
MGSTSKSGGAGWNAASVDETMARPRRPNPSAQSIMESVMSSSTPSAHLYSGYTLLFHGSLGSRRRPYITVSGRESMASGEVLDTAALLAWPVERMSGSLVVPGQRAELVRISPDRELALDAANLIWELPSDDALDRARDLAITTGDMAGLSAVDFELLALAIEMGATLVTDDYRLQNICELGGVAWSSVTTEGIRSMWSWELRCSGCGLIVNTPDTPSPDRNLGNCRECGSELALRRRR